jgi:hypothetical protein
MKYRCDREAAPQPECDGIAQKAAGLFRGVAFTCLHAAGS